MDALYYFIIAAVIACFGISYMVRASMEKLVLEPENSGQIQSKFFMYVAIIETLPIILIVFGFLSLANSTASPFLPIFIVVFTVFANFIITLIKKNELISHSPKIQQTLNTFFFMGIALMTAIPIVALIAIFIR